MADILKKASNVIPYKIIKRINKTGEGRSGDEVYKRRNRRNYRGVMQYGTWDKFKKGELPTEILNEYEEGYIVWISPYEYFGNNYPSRSKDLNKEFVLGQTGFVYYKNPDELIEYPPLPEWRELYELSTKKLDGRREWIGEVCFNIKNANPQRISDICADKNAKRSKDDILHLIQSMGIDLDMYPDIPDQCGIGNYDYDYASERMKENVKYQMLYLILTCEDRDGIKFGEYIRDHFEEIKDEKGKDSNRLQSIIHSPAYMREYLAFFDELEEECRHRGLLDFTKLMDLNAWDPVTKRPICPLCSKSLSCEDFFKEVEQQEGRRVADNTQREVVLMHVNALRPGRLNHRVYNLAWGHSFCNTIQGDKDISETIEELQRIIENYQKHLNKK